MITRTNYDDQIEVLKEISSHYENDVINDAVEFIIKARDEYELKVLVVGHFNAGKSSLINGFIERPSFLKEDLGETTAIASELRYSAEEKAFSFDKSMNKEQYIVGKEYLPSEYDHISYYLNSRGLKEIEDFAIVDTPGFDTSREDHTRALASYLGYGVGFIMVVDVQKGGLDTQSIHYLNEISRYSNNITILINKCDKPIPSEVDKVVDGVKCTLEQYGFDYPVYTISKTDEKIIEKFSQAINDINAQGKYDLAVKDALVSNAKTIEETLKIVLENQYLDTYEFDETIRMQERKKELLSTAFERKKKELIDNLDGDVENVIQQIRAALRGRSDEAARAIENGNTEGLQAIVLDTLRPILVEAIKEFSTDKIREISKSLKVSYSGTLGEDEKGLDDIAIDIGEKIQGLIQSGAFFNEENAKSSAGKKQKKGGTGIYTLVTAALSIVTGGTVTWMEGLVILLPEIVAGLKALFGESNHSKIAKQYEETVIPQVTNSLWPSIQDSFAENIETMVTMFENEMTESLNAVMQLINNAKAKRLESENEYENFKQTIMQDIHLIEKILEENNG